MEGYILSIHRTRDEDLIVSVLTSTRLLTLYRFYGARHSTINIGYKINFETERDGKSTISRLRNILHLGYVWLYDRERMLIWQQFIRLFYPHLKDNDRLDVFYFNLIEHAAARWHLQNPKRLAVESYIALLAHEGRLHNPSDCFLCEQPIIEDPAIVRAFLPTHAHCSHAQIVSSKAFAHLVDYGQAILLDDNAINKLYDILQEGL